MGWVLGPPTSLSPAQGGMGHMPNERLITRTKEDIANAIRKEYPHLAATYGVSRIGLFGSFAKGNPTEASDVDIVVEFERPIGFAFIELAEYLERLLGRDVDVLTPAGIQGIRVEHIAKSIEESVVYVSQESG